VGTVERPNITNLAGLAEKKILCFLHYRYANSENIVFTEKELTQFIKDPHARVLHYALETMRDTIHISHEIVVEDEQEVDGYMISAEGIRWVEGWTDENYENVASGINFLEEIGDKETEASKVPASDRNVPLNHNSSEYIDAINALDRVVSEFAEDHRLDNVLGSEKSALTKILLGGRELLDQQHIGLKLAIGSIVEPLRRLKEIATEHKSTLVGSTWAGIVQTALNSVLKLLGLG
jgi:hypothetical protein